MARGGYNPVEAAARYALNLYHALKDAGVMDEKGYKLKAAGLYTRTRQFPSLIAEVGLLPATAFAIAKVDNHKAVDQAFNVLGGSADSDLNDLVDDATSPGKGYAILAGLIARVAVDSGACQPAERDNVVVQLSRCLLEASKNGKLLPLEATMLAVAQEFKKYMEAFLAKPEKEA